MPCIAIRLLLSLCMLSASALKVTIPSLPVEAKPCVPLAERIRSPSRRELPKVGFLPDPDIVDPIANNSWTNPGMLDLSTQMWPTTSRSCVEKLPKIMHFIWMGSPLKAHHAHHVLDFGNLNPTWSIYLWLDRPLMDKESVLLQSIALRLTVNLIPEMAPAFRNRDLMCEDGSYAGKSDLLRYEVVYQHGGIYADLDSVPFHGFDEYGELFRFPFTVYNQPGPICNCVFGFDRHSEFLRFLIEAVRENCVKFGNCGVMAGAGTGVYQAALLRFSSSDIAFIPSEFMIASPDEPGARERSIMGATFEGAEKGGWYKDFEKGINHEDIGFCEHATGHGQEHISSGVLQERGHVFVEVKMHSLSALKGFRLPTSEEKMKVLNALEGLKKQR